MSSEPSIPDPADSPEHSMRNTLLTLKYLWAQEPSGSPDKIAALCFIDRTERELDYWHGRALLA